MSVKPGSNGCKTITLTLSSPIVSNDYTSKCSGPYWYNPPLKLIFDIWELWRSGLSARVPECQKIKYCALDQYGTQCFSRLIFTRTRLRYVLVFAVAILSVWRLSVVCLSSVTLCTLLRWLNLSAKFLHCCVRWPSSDLRAKFYGDSPRGTPPSGALNARGVSKYSDFRPIEGYIS